jgi:hypothetical protein
VKLLWVRSCHIDEVDGVKKDLFKAGAFTSGVKLVFDTSGEGLRIPPLRGGGVDLDGVYAQFYGGFSGVY